MNYEKKIIWAKTSIEIKECKIKGDFWIHWHTKAKYLIYLRPKFKTQSHVNICLRCGYKVLEIMSAVWPKYPKCPRIYLTNLSAQFVCPCPKVLDFNEKKASLVVCSLCIVGKGIFCLKTHLIFMAIIVNTRRASNK